MSAEAIAIPRLKLDEGFRAAAYPDPITHAEPITIGYGATFHDLKLGTVWTEPQAAADLIKRVAGFAEQLDDQLAWWRTIGPVRAAVLLNMAYNLGIHGLLGFSGTLAAVKALQFELASLKMLQSAWARQVGGRALRLSNQMRTGVLSV